MIFHSHSSCALNCSPKLTDTTEDIKKMEYIYIYIAKFFEGHIGMFESHDIINEGHILFSTYPFFS